MSVFYPILSRFLSVETVNPAAFDDMPGDPIIMVAKRDNLVTPQVYIKSSNTGALFDSQNIDLPESLTNILSSVKNVVFDINSIESDELRFYTYSSDFINDFIKNTFVFTPPLDFTEENKTLIGIGFLMNKVTGLVDYYKYYWFDKVSRIVYNIRFDSSGTFVNLVTETGTLLSSDSILSEFNIEGIDFTNHSLIHITRSDGLNSYITVFPGIKLSGAGGASAVTEH